VEQLQQTLRQCRTENPLYFFVFNTDQWSSDYALGLLSDFQRGWYIELSIAAWKSSGVLENDDDKLFRLAKADNREQWQQHKAEVLDFFDEGCDADGVSVLIHRAMRPHWLDRVEQHRRKQESIKTAREKRQANLQAEQDGKAGQQEQTQ